MLRFLLLVAAFKISNTVSGRFDDNIGFQTNEVLQNIHYYQEFESSIYYASASPGDWASAVQDCKLIFDDNAHLLSIETAEEKDYINKWLQDVSSGGVTFWTSGQYDIEKHGWIWGATGDNIAWFDWREDEPSAPLISVSRIAIEYMNQFSAWWINAQNTSLHRYICEWPNQESTDLTQPPSTTQDPTIPISCPVLHNIVIALHSSSVGEENFQLLKQLIASLADALDDNLGSKISFIVYSETIDTVVDLADNLTPEEVQEKILGAKYQAGPTPTDQAIHEARMMLTKYDPKVPRTYIIITAGDSNDSEKTKHEAETAVSELIRTFALGITDDVSHTELLNIAGGVDHNVFFVEEIANVEELWAMISEQLCPLSIEYDSKNE